MNVQYLPMVVLGLVILLCPACRSESAKEQTNPSVRHFSLERSLNSDSTNLDIDRFLKLKGAIVLGFEEDRPIQNIHKLSVKGPELFILDNVQNYIFVYDMQGTYQSRIGSIGDGPGEYLDITDFTLVDDDEVVVFSSNSRKIIHFSTSGSLLKEIPIDFFGQSIAVVDNGYILYTKNNVHPEHPYDLLLLDAEGKLIDHKRKIQPGFPIMGMTGFMEATENDHLRYMEIFSDTIFEIDKDFNLVPLYHVELGSDKLNIDQVQNPDELLTYFHEHTFLTNHFWENERLALLYYFHQKRMDFGMILKPENRFVTASQFRSNHATKVIRSVNAAILSSDKLLISPRPVFYQSDENFGIIDSLVSWEPGVSEKVDKKELIENSQWADF